MSRNKSLIASTCIALFANISVYLPPANAVDPVITPWVIVKGWLILQGLTTFSEQQNTEPSKNSLEREQDEDFSNTVKSIEFDSELKTEVTNKKIVPVDRGVIVDIGNSVQQSYTVGFDRNVRRNIGGSLGIGLVGKIERAVTEQYAYDFGQQTTASHNVSLNGDECDKYLVETKVSSRSGIISINHLDKEREFDFEVVDSIITDATNLCTLDGELELN